MFCHNLLKLRITVQPVMQKARVEPKTQHSFVDSHENSVEESVWWMWPQPFARCVDFINLGSKINYIARQHLTLKHDKIRFADTWSLVHVSEHQCFVLVSMSCVVLLNIY